MPAYARRVLVLALDTATPAVTVALCEDGKPLAESTVVDPRRHGELLAPGIEAVLAAAARPLSEVEAIVVGVGPGPYTGLRVGLVTAQTLGHVLGVAVHGVCTLDALALDAVALDPGLHGDFVVATDARRKEVYWACYRADGDRIDGPGVSTAANLGWDGPTVGLGAQLYPESLPDGREPVHPRAAALARHRALGRPLLPPVPLYLRQPDAAAPGQRKSVLR